jgi:hypothetical protein
MSAMIAMARVLVEVANGVVEAVSPEAAENIDR